MTSIGRLFTKLTVASLLWIASPAHAVTFKIDDQTVTSGDSISTSITVSGFSSVTSFQFTLIWNPDLLDYSSAGSFGLDFLSGSSFGTTQVSQGKLTVSWDDSSLLGKTLSDGAAIFSVNFNVIGNNGSSAFINLGDDPTEREVTVDFSVAGFDSQSGKIQIGTPQASSPPSIASQPTSTSVISGGSAAFSVVATGTEPLAYQWKKNGTILSGRTESGLTLTGIQLSDSADYSVEVSNSQGSVTSAAATLTVIVPDTGNAPVITAHPTSQTVPVGATVTFVVQASGTSPFTFQWQKNGLIIPGTTGALHSISQAQLTDSGNYSVVVSNSRGSVASFSAILTVTQVSFQEAPVILTTPVGQTVNTGTEVRLSVNATGTTPLSYQWRKDNETLVGQTLSSIVLSDVQSNDAGQYTAVVSNELGSVTSLPAVLTVKVPLPPTPPSIVVQPVNQVKRADESALFTVLADGSTPLLFQWQKNGESIQTATSSSLRLENLKTNDSGNYSVLVKNDFGNISSLPALLVVEQDIITSPKILEHPLNQAVVSGAEVSFSTMATGADPLTFQWTRNGVNLPNGTDRVLSISNAGPDDEGDYRVVVSNLLGSASSVTASLRVRTPPTIIRHSASKIVGIGESIELAVEASGSQPLQFSWRKDGVTLEGANKPAFILTSVEESDSSVYIVVVSNDVGEAVSMPIEIQVLVSETEAKGDFNRDGNSDIIFQDSDGFVAAWLMAGAKLNGGKLLTPSNVGDIRWQVVATGDFNDDGRSDLFFQHADGHLAVWHMNGTQLLSAALLQPDSPSSVDWRAVGTGDFNKDGSEDLLFQKDDGSIAIWFMQGTRLELATLTDPPALEDSNWRIAATGEFDGDEQVDIVFQHADGSLAIWLMNGAVLKTSLLTNPPDAGSPDWRVVGAGDYNGNGTTDLLFQNKTTYDIAIWFMNGLSLSEAELTEPVNPGGTWRILPAWRN